MNVQSPGASTVNVPAKRSLPSGDERLFSLPLRARRGDEDRGAEGVVAVLEDGGGHLDLVADDRARRIAAAVDDRLESLDLNAGWWLGCSWEWHSA